MAEFEQEQWKKTIEEFSKKSNQVYNKLIASAKNFGELSAGTKAELEKITAKLDKPFYKTLDFYKLLFEIIKIAIFVILAMIILQKGGCFYIKDFATLGQCNYQQEKIGAPTGKSISPNPKM